VATFVLATANPHKAEEMRDVLAPLGVELKDRPVDVPDVDETESTLEGNALLKARALVAATGIAAIADDTGLFIDALDGRPGVWSARYAGVNATYADNVDKALRELRDVPDDERGARFRTVIAVVYPDGTSWYVEGALVGVMARAPRG
jgi:XTP/dITP diphosphohydrolase